MIFEKHANLKYKYGVIQQIKYGQNKQIICGLLSGLA